MIMIKTTRIQREVVRSALDIGKKLAQDVASGARRLGLVEQPALDTIGTLAYLRGEFDKIMPAEQGVAAVELTPAAAKVLRITLGLWASKALQKDKDAKQYVLITNVSKVEKEAQELVDRLSGALELPSLDIGDLDGAKEEEPEGDTDPVKAKKAAKAPKKKASAKK